MSFNIIIKRKQGRIAKNERNKDRHKDKEGRKLYYNHYYTALRLQLLEKFGNKCNRCGITNDSKHMHFHHLTYEGSYYDGKQENYHPYKQLKEVLNHPEMFTLLCDSCHMVITNCKGEILIL